MIDPYEQTLTGARVAVRQDWAWRVFQQMESAGLTAGSKTILWLADQAYMRELSKLLHAHAHIDPLAGMRFGTRLAWLRAQAGGVIAAQRPIAGEHVHRTLVRRGAAPREKKLAVLRHRGTSRYQPLADYPQESGAPVVELTFAEVADLLGGLPASAYKHGVWWSNGSGGAQSRDGWLAAGYRMESADRTRQTVTFRRE